MSGCEFVTRLKDKGNHYPLVSIRATHELLVSIPDGQWKIPEPQGLETEKYLFRKKWNDGMGSWLRFLNQAEKGMAIQAVSNQITGSKDSFNAYVLFKNIMPNASTEHIHSIKRGFAALLSQEAQEGLRLSAEDIHASPEDILRTRLFIQTYAKQIVEDLPFGFPPPQEDSIIY